MTSAVDSHPGTESLVQQHDAISQVVRLCLEGEATGDLEKLREAFHEDAHMFGSLAGERFDVPIAGLMEMVGSAPTDTGSYRSRILSILQTGDAALVTVAEEGCWGSVSFVDYLSLSRIGGRWKIVSKLFAHTGGEPPDLG